MERSGAGVMAGGLIDHVARDRVSGWARDPEFPDAPVALLITVDDVVVTRVLADRPREDLRQAGIGNGRHSFEVALHGLSPLEPHVVAVRRERDGVHLEGSPAIVEKAGRFDAAFQAHCAALLGDATDDAELDERLDFLAAQAEQLLQLRAARRSRRSERMTRRQIKWRLTGAGDSGGGPDPLPRRALFVDERAPVRSRDAGSNAILSHMQSLRRLGFEPIFVAADMARDTHGALDAAGITSCHGPWHGSVEEVLRREADSFDLVYLHRASIASRYLSLVRYHQPKARIVYSVADLHHVRFARQAQAEDRPELLTLARQFQTIELRAAAAANAVITHSASEAALLRQHLPHVNVHVVPWTVPPQPTAIPWRERHGLAFIGFFGHPPNVDAAQWLVSEIIPRLRETHPSITCVLAGSDMPDILRRAGPGIEAIGHVTSLSRVFDRVRLTIAPMTYGAGIKGKVLESLAAGIPCVCTPVAAEGLDLPPALRSLVAADARGLAAGIGRLHEDDAFNAACADEGLAYVGARLSRARIDALMREVAALPPDVQLETRGVLARAGH